MAGSIVVTTVDKGQSVTEYKLAWTSDASGDVSGADGQFSLMRGLVWAVKFVPGTGGNQPTDLYDVKLNDADTVDLIVATGDNLSNSTSSRNIPHKNNLPMFFEGGTVTLVVANAGNAKKGTVYIYMQG